jgi:hypothetical protein
MTEAERIAELRELFVSAPEAASTRAIAVIGSLVLAALVLWLVRRRSLREELTPMWMAVAVAVAAVGLWPALLLAITRAIGAWTPSSTIFFFALVFLTAISLHYAVRLSALTLELKNVVQELALLRERVDERDAAPLRAPGSRD